MSFASTNKLHFALLVDDAIQEKVENKTDSWITRAE